MTTIVQETNKQNNTSCFIDINFGDMFRYNGKVYIKTQNSYQNKGLMNALVYKDKGRWDINHFDGTEQVTLIDTVITIKQ